MDGNEYTSEMFTVPPMPCLKGSIAINLFIQRTLNVGIGAVGLILVAYGCLGLLHSGSLFLALSMVLR